MENEIKQLRTEALSEIEQAKTQDTLENLRIKYLGRQGEINKILEKIPQIPEEERPQIGRLANHAKEKIEQALSSQISNIKYQLSKPEWLDVTRPGIKPLLGHIHPVTQVVWELSEIFTQMGYEIVEGPEVENDYYNFEALNIPKHHPSRDLQDTFWLTDGMLPRTHTSAMQVRVMEKREPPFKIAVPGWVFRSEKEDATHAATFHHYEGFVVGKDIAFSDLKGSLYVMLQKLLGYEIRLKFRASYFPYVEPCAEISASCIHCDTKGCKACGGDGWLEIMGCGMIHPVVLKNSNIDPNKNSGFAYVFGTTRIAMIRYQINDIRLLMSGDLRFLQQF